MYVRAARFEGIDRANIDRDIEDFRKMVRMEERPEGMSEETYSTLRTGVRRVMSLVDRDEGTSLDLIFTDTAEDAQRVHEVLDAMSPPEGAGQRTSVQTFELLMDEQPGSRGSPAGGRVALPNLLQDPGVAVGVGEVREGRVRAVLGVGSGSPFGGLAVEVTHVADLDATGDQLLPSRLDVPDDEVRAAIRAGLGIGDPDADRDGAGRSRRRHLHDAERLAR